MNITFKTLSEPNRLQIVELLKDGPLSVGEVAKCLGLNQPQTSKHLRVLMDAGLVEVDAMPIVEFISFAHNRSRNLTTGCTLSRTFGMSGLIAWTIIWRICKETKGPRRRAVSNSDF